MKTVAIITEYNPFHNGHLYQINEVRKQTNADCIIVVMSGNFVQRGTPAIIDKYSRTKLALDNGVDIVFELPLYYATASAELFAFGAVNMINSFGTVDYLCFGSECGDISVLYKIANLFLEEPEKYKSYLKTHLKLGLSYPLARNKALLEYLNDDPVISDILKQPNNILGIEYIKAILKLKSNIKPLTITRVGAGYHDPEFKNFFCSATAIRNYFTSNNHNESSIEPYIPSTTNQLLIASYNYLFPITENDFTALLYYKLQLETNESLLNYLDMTSELANRIKNEVNYTLNFYDIVNKLKTKQYTFTRVQRSLLHVLLGITSENMGLLINSKDSSYARVLGFRKSSSVELKRIIKEGTIPLVTKVADARKNLSNHAIISFEADIKATHLYNLVVYDKFKTSLKNEYQMGPVMSD